MSNTKKRSTKTLKVGRRHLLAVLTVAVGIFGLMAAGRLGGDDSAPLSAATVDVSQFRTGGTLTQYSIDEWGNSAAVARGRSLLLGSTSIVNQHIMGFGALSPEPSPDQYELSTIINRIGATQGTANGAETIVLTACCSPDWMKGGQAGETDWTQIEVAPLPQFYDDYTELVVEIVTHPEMANVEYLQVWNEMKGMWNSSLNRWDYEGYTTLYNKIWDAVKRVRPDIKIGGPYVVIGSFGGGTFNDAQAGGVWGKFDQRDLDVVTYWLQNKRGADFITVDGWNHNRNAVEQVEPFERTRKFTDFTQWLRGLDESQYPGATTLPLWWAEWYAFTDDGLQSPVDEQNALMTTALMRIVGSGAETALLWDVQGDTQGRAEPLALFTDTRVAGGGQPTAFYETQQIVHDHFSAGVQLLDTASSNTQVEALVSDQKIMLVNMSAQRQTTNVGSQRFVLEPYEVSLHDNIGSEPPIVVVNSGQPVTINSQSRVEIPITISGIDVDKIDVFVGGSFTKQLAANAQAYVADIYNDAIENGTVMVSISVHSQQGIVTESEPVQLRVRHADINRDGSVEIGDLSRLLGDWADSSEQSDLDGDGEVGIVDLSRLLSRWGSSD